MTRRSRRSRVDSLPDFPAVFPRNALIGGVAPSIPPMSPFPRRPQPLVAQ